VDKCCDVSFHGVAKCESYRVSEIYTFVSHSCKDYSSLHIFTYIFEHGEQECKLVEKNIFVVYNIFYKYCHILIGIVSHCVNVLNHLIDPMHIYRRCPSNYLRSPKISRRSTFLPLRQSIFALRKGNTSPSSDKPIHFPYVPATASSFSRSL